MTSRKNQRTVRKTLLIVGEGSDEKAFLGHLKILYSTAAGPRVRVISADGRAPDGPVNEAISLKEKHEYDKVVVLLDTDIAWTEEKIKEAKEKNIELVGSEPCLEGLLLKILNKSVPEKSKKCKTKLQNILRGKPTETRSYVPLFKKELLDKARKKVKPLDTLISYISGKKIKIY